MAIEGLSRFLSYIMEFDTVVVQVVTDDLNDLGMIIPERKRERRAVFSVAACGRYFFGVIS